MSLNEINENSRAFTGGRTVRILGRKHGVFNLDGTHQMSCISNENRTQTTDRKSRELKLYRDRELCDRILKAISVNTILTFPS